MHQLSNTEEVFVCHCIFFLVENRYFKQIFRNSVQSVAKIHILYVVVVLKYSTCFENNSFNPEIPIDQSDNMDPCVW